MKDDVEVAIIMVSMKYIYIQILTSALIKHCYNIESEMVSMPFNLAVFEGKYPSSLVYK
jgi:hypothetical protein